MKKEKKEEGRIRVIIVMMMVMGCNSGGVKDAEKVFLSEMVNLGKGFMEVFVSFGDMITGTLGIKAETKKSEIGKYFSDIADTMESVKNKLQAEVAKNSKYEKVKTVVDEFITGTLDRIATGAKEAAKGATTDAAIGNAKQNEDAVPGDIASVNSLVKGIKEIVGVVLKKGEGDPNATKTGETEQKSVGNLLATQNDVTEQQAAAASASIGAISGADILQAISHSEDVSVSKDINTVINVAEIAVAKKDSVTKTLDQAKKDAVIVGGIALRAMAKEGRFAAKNGDVKYPNAVNGAVASAVNKVLSTLVIAIRNRVDLGLKEINKLLGEIKQVEGSESKVKAN
ncbi:Variable outer membrane protein (plasmid) [Borrelia crocidurae DOU]|uniref:Variable large protein n=1 Tax=Borrelia crocidurae DOU TaxID=1293575 RepID=W5SKB9_9SPIR|nr:variable large family protein [Borrelia crocidurae]AHH07103.1 Variable outer membrane protein [Borrelia crocidurae DOU]